MKMEFIILLVCLCALFLCIGVIVGFFMNFKIDKEYMLKVIDNSKEYIRETKNMILENQKSIARWIDEINKSCYVPIWKYVEKELPECDGIYYGLIR